eukprot:gene1283-2477_t
MSKTFHLWQNLDKSKVDLWSFTLHNGDKAGALKQTDHQSFNSSLGNGRGVCSPGFYTALSINTETLQQHKIGLSPHMEKMSLITLTTHNNPKMDSSVVPESAAPARKKYFSPAFQTTTENLASFRGRGTDDTMALDRICAKDLLLGSIQCTLNQAKAVRARLFKVYLPREKQRRTCTLLTRMMEHESLMMKLNIHRSSGTSYTNVGLPSSSNSCDQGTI